MFLAAGADVRAISVNNAPRPRKRGSLTTLMLAADEPEKMRILLAQGADPSQQGTDGVELVEHLRNELAMAEEWLMERPEKKRAGSAYEKLRNARAESLALVEALPPPLPDRAR